MAVKVTMSRKQFAEEDSNVLTGEFKIRDDGKVVGICAFVITRGNAEQFGIHIAIGSPNAEKKLGFSDLQELELYGPVAAAFLQLCGLAGRSVWTGAGLDSPSAAFLAIGEDDDAEDA